MKSPFPRLAGVIKRWKWFVAVLILCALAAPVVGMRISTLLAISKIEALQGGKGDFAGLTKNIQTRYSRIDSAAGLERALTRMGLQSASNLSAVRFNGEGLPYFWGYVAYDSTQQVIVRSVVDQLW